MRMKRLIPRTAWLTGLIITVVLVISACAAQPAPTGDQAGAVTEEQVSEQAPTGLPTATEPTSEHLPTETSQADSSEVTEGVAPTVTEQDTEGDASAEGYPEPGDQYPPPAAGAEVEPYPSPVEVVPPPVKTALVATDPATVDLATGKPQLLEFFAFW